MGGQSCPKYGKLTTPKLHIYCHCPFFFKKSVPSYILNGKNILSLSGLKYGLRGSGLIIVAVSSLLLIPQFLHSHSPHLFPPHMGTRIRITLTSIAVLLVKVLSQH